MAIPVEWQKINETNVNGIKNTLERTKIFGGWLLKSVHYNTSNLPFDTELQFIADANWEWEV